MIMIELGKYNRLRVVKELDFGLYLDGGPAGEILLPRRYVPEGCAVGSELEVFLYRDSEDRVIATTERPYATVGEFALLRVRSTDRVGAFLDWGLSKDLLVPFREQKVPMQAGRSYLVAIYLDRETDRIAASAKLHKFLDHIAPAYAPNQEVGLLVENETDLGYRVIVDDRHWGLLYRNELYRTLNKGERLQGYVRQVREDDKIDVSLQPSGYGKIDPLAQRIEAELDAAGGFLPLSDRSPAEAMARMFGCSKRDFKKAVGALYKSRRILISDDGIRRADDAVERSEK